ncbi:hypothetical protein [Sporomusa acidovorans]|uniref:Uncharacterized protein n=1 Tax=Sporomusa acidovorans (strain ATCC 49682 / DSM 3132 / Mol) TaxID=1123286 RepID=A0ABZ3IZQ1_SPOA4|nr:hypothetical protein [Sporomusa acidovorans]OZC17250.1 hypothetical protein SPACI_39000 [Sporomusa acidovorans DSM 3132]SDF15746.1 hypothetical protein SAMN04488499_103533 [Sporomusa acidovorans]
MSKKEWGKPLVTKLDILMTEYWLDDFEKWFRGLYPGLPMPDGDHFKKYYEQWQATLGGS